MKLRVTMKPVSVSGKIEIAYRDPKTGAIKTLGKFGYFDEIDVADDITEIVLSQNQKKVEVVAQKQDEEPQQGVEITVEQAKEFRPEPVTVHRAKYQGTKRGKMKK